MKCLQVRDVTEYFVFLRYGTNCCYPHSSGAVYLSYKFCWRSLFGHDGKTQLRNSWVTYVTWPFL